MLISYKHVYMSVITRMTYVIQYLADDLLKSVIRKYINISKLEPL